MASLGHPVLGDRLYSARAVIASRPLPRAARLSLPHPRTGEFVSVTAPPADLAARWPSGMSLPV